MDRQSTCVFKLPSLILFLLTTAAVARAARKTSPPPSPSACGVDMRILLVSSDGSEADFPAIKQVLGYIGTPYTVFFTSTGTLSAAQLSDGGCHGYYQGVIFTFGNWIYNMGGGAAALQAYEKAFGIRQVNWYAYPGVDFGLNTATNAVDTTTSPISASFTAAGQPVFFYANTANPITIQYAYTYLAKPISGATPVLVDGSGNALAVLYTNPSASDYLTLTFDSNQYLKHDLVLAYGLVNWVTKGLFLGSYHVYAAAQVDDVFIDDSEWIPSTPCLDPTLSFDRTAVDAPSLPVFRITASDVDALANWQNAKRQDPLLSNFKLSLAINGVGTTGDTDWTGLATGAVDTLTPELKAQQTNFYFMSHTYDHPDTLNNMTQGQINYELNSNNYVAIGKKGSNIDKTHTLTPLGLTNYNPQNLVTPGVTGLNDPYVPQYLVNDGIRYVVTDTSVTGQTNNGPNPSPNVGIVNSYAAQLYEVPRHPNDIFYNVAKPDDSQAEFDCIYSFNSDGSPAPTASTFGVYTWPQILDFVSSGFLTNMLMGDMDPEMFHQTNLHNYDGQGHSLITDVYDQTFNKYKAVFNLPVMSLPLDQIGQKMQARGQYNQSGVTATYAPGVSITITAQRAAVIPVTGLKSTGAEAYGGQYISSITLAAGQTVTLPLQ